MLYNSIIMLFLFIIKYSSWWLFPDHYQKKFSEHASDVIYIPLISLTTHYDELSNIMMYVWACARLWSSKALQAGAAQWCLPAATQALLPELRTGSDLRGFALVQPVTYIWDGNTWSDDVGLFCKKEYFLNNPDGTVWLIRWDNLFPLVLRSIAHFEVVVC